MGDFRGNSLAVWYLENPLDPRLVGQVKLEASNRRCLLELNDEWRRSGFPLSPDLTLDKKVHAPLKDMVAASVIDMPEIGASLELSEIYDTLMPRNRPRLQVVEEINGRKPR